MGVFHGSLLCIDNGAALHATTSWSRSSALHSKAGLLAYRPSCRRIRPRGYRQGWEVVLWVELWLPSAKVTLTFAGGKRGIALRVLWAATSSPWSSFMAALVAPMT